MKTKTKKLAYEAPEASVDVIEMERSILSQVNTNGLSDMNSNLIYDEFEDE